MAVVLKLDQTTTRPDHVLTSEQLRNLIVIVGEPTAKVSSAPAPRPTAWTFDDDDLITWEDAEWQ
jgi:hypothetical protein